MCHFVEIEGFFGNGNGNAFCFWNNKGKDNIGNMFGNIFLKLFLETFSESESFLENIIILFSELSKMQALYNWIILKMNMLIIFIFKMKNSTSPKVF